MNIKYLPTAEDIPLGVNFSTAYRNIIEYKIKGSPLLQGFPSFKTVHWTVLKFTPFGALLRQKISPSADGDQRASALWTPDQLCSAGPATVNMMSFIAL